MDVGSLLTDKERGEKRLGQFCFTSTKARWLIRDGKKGWIMTHINTLATHAGLVLDVSHTDCLAQNGSAHGRVFAV